MTAIGNFPGGASLDLLYAHVGTTVWMLSANRPEVYAASGWPTFVRRGRWRCLLSLRPQRWAVSRIAVSGSCASPYDFETAVGCSECLTCRHQS